MTDIDVYAVTIKLIGPVNPVGDSRIDEDRLKNLKRMIDLVDYLLTDIDRLTARRDDGRASVKKAGKTAWDFMEQVGG